MWPFDISPNTNFVIIKTGKERATGEMIKKHVTVGQHRAQFKSLDHQTFLQKLLFKKCTGWLIEQFQL